MDKATGPEAESQVTPNVNAARALWEQLKTGDIRGHISAEVIAEHMYDALAQAGKDITVLEPGKHATVHDMKAEIDGVMRWNNVLVARALWKNLQEGEFGTYYSPQPLVDAIHRALEKAGADASVLCGREHSTPKEMEALIEQTKMRHVTHHTGRSWHQH